MNEQPSILCIARIQKPKGLKGLLRLTAFGEFLDIIPKPHKLSLYTSKKVLDGFLVHPQKKTEIILKEVKSRQNEVAIIRVEDIDSPEKANTLKGYYIGMPLDEAQEKFADDNQPYYFQYLNLNIFDLNLNSSIGKILRIEEITNKAMAVFFSDEKKAEFYLPLDHPAIQKVDFNENKIMVENATDFIYDD